MKKFIYYNLIAIGSFLLFTPISSHATIHNVEVEDFEFNPSNFIANVGDTIHWFWDEGFHTTTSFIIPNGAAPWNQPISSATPTFEYVITVPGSYDYICSPHASMGMTGHFTALGATGINESVPTLAFINSYINGGYLNFDYSSPGVDELTFEIYDIVGHRVHREFAENNSTGVHSHSIYVGTLPKGIYIFTLLTADSKKSKRIVID